MLKELTQHALLSDEILGISALIYHSAVDGKNVTNMLAEKKKGAKCLTAPVIPVSPRFIYALFDPTNAEPSTCSVVYSRPCNSRLKIKRVSDIKT